MRGLLLGVALGLSFQGSKMRAQATGLGVTGDYARRIDSAVDAVRRTRGVPGVVVLIATGDQPAFARGYGYADVASRTPFTASTRFNLASNAKQFVAVSILQLAERGALSLDDDV